jgi:group I intron endonuclease
MQIYLITNLVTGTLYVGQTQGSLRRRWKRHLSQSRNGSSLYLHRSIRKYGVENFTIVPLRPIEFDITTEDELNGWEREMIRALRNTNQLYNLTDGGAGTIGFPRSGSRGTFTKGHIPWMRGKHHSGESRRLMRQAALGNQRMLGRKHSEKTIQKISDSKKGSTPWIKGRHHSETSNDKNRQAHLGKSTPKLRALTEAQVSEILTLRSQGHTQASIAKQFGVHQSTISKYCLGQHCD